jgi:hypothetical protein
MAIGTGSRRPYERLSLRIADRISKREWRMRGGMENPRLARVTRGRGLYILPPHKAAP